VALGAVFSQKRNDFMGEIERRIRDCVCRTAKEPTTKKAAQCGGESRGRHAAAVRVMGTEPGLVRWPLPAGDDSIFAGKSSPV